jgi:hypothetical protein
MSTVDTDTAISAIDKIKESTLAGMKSDEIKSIDKALGGDKNLAGVFDDLRDLVNGITVGDGIFANKNHGIKADDLYEEMWTTLKELGHLLDWDNTWMHVDYLADLLDFVRAFGKFLGKEERHEDDIFFEGWEPAVVEDVLEGDKVLGNDDDSIVRVYTMAYGDSSWWNYIVMFHSFGEQDKVFIENSKGTFLQDGMKLFYHEDHKDQFRLEEDGFEEDKWAELTYED